MLKPDLLRRGVNVIFHMAEGQVMAKRHPLSAENRKRINDDTEAVRHVLYVVEQTIRRVERNEAKRLKKKEPKQ